MRSITDPWSDAPTNFEHTELYSRKYRYYIFIPAGDFFKCDFNLYSLLKLVG